ncbi:MAG: DUF1501 domain-containing protein [Vitreoscilla sp.]|nr:DUF1501 domain-containing protein [Burkholderiales bacterium]MBP6338190.1 DUF1501 domain-containing protein [Vitreoscilla sp.]MBP6674362.1 DUF1501 domain-containing protein [Vitreoscilla sp.]
MKRRRLLSATAGLSLMPLGSRLWAAPAADLPRFLLVFLRGAYDAHNLLVPQSSPYYHEARPTLAIARVGSGENAALALPGQTDWALAPAVGDALLPLWQRQQLAFVPFAGSDDTTRSHFETQDTFEMGQGSGGRRDFRSGFLNRLAGVLGASARSGAGHEALAFTDQVPLVFRGPQAVANHALRYLGKAGVDGRQSASIERMYQGTALQTAVSNGFETRTEVMNEMAGEMQQASRNAMGTRGFETEARRIGRLMRERIALGFVDVGGWDTHARQGGATGPLADKLGELSRGLVALATELGPVWQRTVVVVASEFGRTFRENGTRGTDHGHGSTYWVLGGGLRGGRVAGEQQALRADTLFQGRDTPVLNEYRALLAGLWARQYGLSQGQLATVFEGITPVDLGLV